MEIEAKFSIPDRATFERLLALTELAGYRLERVGIKRVHDRYLDTRERSILQAGYACRLRRQGNKRTATLKGLGGADAGSGIHHRAEYEVMVEEDEPAAWPADPARDLALRLSDGEPLIELFSLTQERNLCLLYDGPATNRRYVTELSLDTVMHDVDGRGSVHAYYELELELLEQGRDTDLVALSSALRELWGLVPETLSKFERGLALIDCMAQTGVIGDVDGKVIDKDGTSRS